MQHAIGYRLRLKSHGLVTNTKGQCTPVWRFFQSCRVGQERTLGRRWCLGQRIWVTGTRLVDEWLIVLSDRPAPLSEYALRWPIETLFGCLKSRGFCLEAAHVIPAERLSKLLGLLAIAFVWSLAAGAQRSGECALLVAGIAPAENTDALFWQIYKDHFLNADAPIVRL